MFDSVLTKAGLDVGKLKKMLAQDQSELRDLFQKQKANAAHGLLAGRLAQRRSSSRAASEVKPKIIRSSSKEVGPSR